MRLQSSQRTPLGRSKPTKSPSGEQWLNLKPRVTYLYREMDMSLKDVMELMILEHDFNATVKMYKSHLTAWGLRKNNRLYEARAIKRKKRALDAQGLSSVFIVRGQLADMDDIERCCQRAKEQLLESDSGGKEPLPEGIECVIVPSQLSTITSPKRFRTLERFLHHAAVYVDSCFDQGLWRSTSDDDDLTHSFQGNGNTIKLCFDNLGHAAASVNKGRFQLGGAYVQSALDKFPTVLLTDHQDVVPTLLVQLQQIQMKGLHKLVAFIVQSLSELAVQTLPPAHPHETFFLALKDLASESMESIYEVYMAQRRSLYAQNLGVHHFRVVRTDCLPSKGNNLALKPWRDIQDAIARGDDQYGLHSRRAFQVLRSYCYRIYGAGRWSEAVVLFRELILRAEQAGNYNTRVSAQYRLGKIHYQQGNSAEAKAYWLEVLKLAQDDVDVFKYWGLEVLESLATVCRERGEMGEAELYDADLASYHQAVLLRDESSLRRHSFHASLLFENHTGGSELCLASPRDRNIPPRNQETSATAEKCLLRRLYGTQWNHVAYGHNTNIATYNPGPPDPTSWAAPLLPQFCPYQMNQLRTTTIPSGDW